jgi:hypothetical protein
MWLQVLLLPRRTRMVIDVEQAGFASRVLPEDFLLPTWTDNTLEQGADGQRRYTVMSDMYQIGLMLEGCASSCGALSPAADQFIARLKAKQLTAAQALQQEWLMKGHAG